MDDSGYGMETQVSTFEVILSVAWFIAIYVSLGYMAIWSFQTLYPSVPIQLDMSTASAAGFLVFLVNAMINGFRRTCSNGG